MPEHFINLNCANCGGKLEVYDDMDRFACGYCGTEQIVQRRGGTVALKAVTEAIQTVQIGTDKKAAELAVFRLRNLRSFTTRGQGLGFNYAVDFRPVGPTSEDFLINIRECP
jgi:ribosomal protein S27AE